MKKKICLLLFVLLCVCLTGTALTGCVKQHSYTLVSTTESTCTVAGVEVYSCTDCGKQKTTPLPLAPHAEVRHEGKAPTCIAEGWAEYVTCSSCDYTTYEALPATGVHTWDEGEVTKAPTCEGFGERTYQCIHCENASMTERIAASGHSIISYEGKAPTCSEVGWAAYEACENCDYTTYEEIPATGEHKWDEGKITQNPTCVSVGERTYTCTVCFDATRAEEIPPTGIHTWSEGTVTKEPSCVSVGERTYTCTVCSKAKMTEEISATGHKTVTHNAKAPTCAKIGWAEYVTCENCDYTTYEAIPATGEHKWDEGTVTKEPSCEVAGQRSYKCTTCSGAFRVEAISPTGHSYSTDWSSNEEYHYHACACGDWVDEARHISSGSASLTEAEVCTVCGYIIHEKLAYDPNLILELCDSGYKLVGLHDKNVSEVIIPDIVTTIGYEAFSNCTNLTSVVIPDSVTTIGNEAFYNCTNLTSVVIPDSVTTIGSYAFISCSSLTNISVDEGNVVYKSIDGNLYSKDGKELVQYAIGKKDSSFTVPNSVTTIGNEAFSNCTNLTSVVIPDSVTEIGYAAFYNSDSLTSVVIPDSVTVIGNSAFHSCTSLTSVVIPDSVTTIGDYAFSSCSSLTNISVDEGNTAYKSIDGNLYSKDGKELVQYAMGKKDSSFTIPNSVTTIGDNAFGGCTNLTSVVIGKSVTTIGEYAFFYCTALTSVEIPDSVTTIGDRAFRECTSLTSVVIGSSVTTIGYYAFEDCKNLTSVVIGSSVTTIGKSAFYNCTKLTTVYYNGTAEEWAQITIGSYNSYLTNATRYYYSEAQPTAEGNYWHYNAEGEIEIWEGYVAPGSVGLKYTLRSDGTYSVSRGTCTDTEIVIPAIYEGKTVTAIDFQAFYNCTALISVVIPDSVTTIYSQAFYKCTALTSVEIGDSVTTISVGAFYHCASLTNISVDEGNTAYKSIDGNLYSKDGKELVQYAIGKKDSSFTVPNSVTTIGNYAFEDCKNLTSVEIPDSVTTIGYYAFLNCTSLTSVVIGDSVKTIGHRAFYSCTSLTSVVIPDSVTTIGEGAFYDCASLTNISVDEGNTAYKSIDGNLYSKDGKELVQYAIGKKDSSFTIPNSVTTIGEEAFSWCTNLTSVEIADSVTTIGEWAFAECTSLTSVVIPDSVTTIGDQAFRSCKSLTSVVIPDSVTTIGVSAFNGCSGLTSVVIPDSVTTISDYAFSGCDRLISVEIGDSVTAIGYEAFYYCLKLVEVYNKSSLNFTEGSSSYGYVGYYAKNIYTPKSGASKLSNDNGYIIYTNGAKKLLMGYTGTATELTLPSYITQIYRYAFYENTNITKVIIPDSVTTIGDHAFYSCDSLTSVVIGNSVTTIGSSAFSWCYKLVEVYNKSSLTITAGSTSYGYVGYYAKNIYTPTSGASKLSNDNGYLVYTDGEEKLLMGYTGTATELTLPSYITQIYRYAFYNNDNITKVIIPDSVTTIGDYAFSSCTNLTSVVIGKSVTAIGDLAFASCKNLTSVIIPDSVTTIGDYAFRECTRLTSVVIGNSVTAIGDDAFYNCDSLTSVVIPDSVTTIGKGAFNNCNKLTTVYYNGTAEEWGNISVGSNNAPLTDATRYYYRETQPYEEGNYWHYNEKGEIEIWEVIIASKGLRYKLLSDDTYEVWSIGTCSDRAIVIPASYEGKAVTAIGSEAFYDCYSLTRVDIPNTVTSIGDYAFYGCEGFTEVLLPEGVVTVGEYAFAYCYLLNSVYIPDTVTEISDRAFYCCYELASVRMGNRVERIGEDAFCGAAFQNIIIPQSVREIGEGAFFSCDSLTSVVIPKGVTKIGKGAFSLCNALSDIYVVEDNAYYRSIDGNLYTKDGKVLMQYAIGKAAESFVLPEGVTTVKYYAFSFGTLKQISLPASLSTVEGKAMMYCYSLNSITVAAANPIYKSIDGNLYTKDGKILLMYAIGKTSASFTVPAGVTSVASYAFYCCDTLKSVTVAGDVTAIGEYAFSDCTSLETVTFGNKLLTVGAHAFSYCDKLKSVVIPNSVTEIGNLAFYGCDGIGSVTVGSGVVRIGYCAFGSCDLDTVIFRDTTTWYCVESRTDWKNGTGGTNAGVSSTDTVGNANRLSTLYAEYYWYKK